jgi:glutamine amidotransferase
MIAIADAGVGNLRSVEKAFAFLGHEAIVTSDAALVARASAVVVPGQGAFGDCMRGLAGGLGSAIRDAIDAGRPYLGICLGLQVLFEGSEESGGCEGLGMLRGRVTKLADGVPLEGGRRRKVPHMGWSRTRGGDLDGAWFYFAHSFHVRPADPTVAVSFADYGEPIVAAVARPNLVAVQFHPEKSQRAGLALLDRFARSAA